MINSLLGNFRRNPNLWRVISIAILVLILIPRFNQQNLGPVKKLVGNKGHLGEYSYDVNSYISNVKFFRNTIETDDDKKSLSEPFTYRVLPTYLASLLPFKEITSINIINVLSIFFSLVLLELILIQLGFDIASITLTRLLYIISFPVFYFGTSGHVDPFLIGLIFFGIYSSINKNFLLVLLTIGLGAFSKETIILIIPFYFLFNGFKVRSFIESIALFIIYLIGSYYTRNIIPLDSNYLWVADQDTITMNLTRSRTYLSFILGFGHFSVLILASYFRKRNFKDLMPFYLSTISALAVFVYAIFAAYPDARFIWLAYPFSMPIIASLFQEKTSS